MKYLFLTAFALAQFSCGHSDTALSPENTKLVKHLPGNLDPVTITPGWKADFSFETDGEGKIIVSGEI